MNRAANARVGAATANVAGHGFVNILIGRRGIFSKQHGGAHDLAGLAIAALGDVNFDPRLLQRMRVIG